MGGLAARRAATIRTTDAVPPTDVPIPLEKPSRDPKRSLLPGNAMRDPRLRGELPTVVLVPPEIGEERVHVRVRRRKAQPLLDAIHGDRDVSVEILVDPGIQR